MKCHNPKISSFFDVHITNQGVLFITCERRANYSTMNMPGQKTLVNDLQSSVRRLNGLSDMVVSPDWLGRAHC